MAMTDNQISRKKVDRINTGNSAIKRNNSEVTRRVDKVQCISSMSECSLPSVVVLIHVGMAFLKTNK